MVILHLSLHLTVEKRSFKEKMARLDWVAIIVLIASLSSILFGLLSGGVLHPWSSPAIITPLIVGFFGLIGFGLIEAFWSRRGIPVVPLEAMQNSSVLVALFGAFVGGYCVTNLAYFLIIYVSTR
jgi:hypothetical protein